MTDPSLMRGDGWVRCCICGELHTAPFDHLARDADGQLWDACEGDCANAIKATGPSQLDNAPRS